MLKIRPYKSLENFLFFNVIQKNEATHTRSFYAIDFIPQNSPRPPAPQKQYKNVGRV